MVYDEGGAPIRRVDGSTEAGFQRVAWDLRYPAAKGGKHEEDTAGFFTRRGGKGPLSVGGTYSVRMFQKVGGGVTELAGPQSFKVTTEQSASMTEADRAAQEEFLRKASRLYRAVYGATRTAEGAEGARKKSE